MIAALGKHVRKLPQELRRSLTWDCGKEMADTRASSSPPPCGSISAIRAVLASAAATRTQTPCCDGIFDGDRSLALLSRPSIVFVAPATGWKAQRVQKCWNMERVTCSTASVYLPLNRSISKLTKKASVASTRNIASF